MAGGSCTDGAGIYHLLGCMAFMRKPDIAKQLARRSRVSQAEAADRLDLILHNILSDLRRGREPALPGLGKFKHGPNGQVAFEPETRGHE